MTMMKLLKISKNKKKDNKKEKSKDKTINNESDNSNEVYTENNQNSNTEGFKRILLVTKRHKLKQINVCKKKVVLNIME